MPKWIATVLLLFFAGCQSDSDVLSSDELNALLSQEPKIAFKRFGVSGTAVLKSDNTFTANVPRLGADQGTWWLDGNSICSRWDQLKKGTDLCTLVARLPDDSYAGLSVKSKTRLGTFRILR